jgi:hypothetical protein
MNTDTQYATRGRHPSTSSLALLEGKLREGSALGVILSEVKDLLFV